MMVPPRSTFLQTACRRVAPVRSRVDGVVSLATATVAPRLRHEDASVVAGVAPIALCGVQRRRTRWCRPCRRAIAMVEQRKDDAARTSRPSFTPIELRRSLAVIERPPMYPPRARTRVAIIVATLVIAIVALSVYLLATG
jgi:hypothetical protein